MNEIYNLTVLPEAKFAMFLHTHMQHIDVSNVETQLKPITRLKSVPYHTKKK